MSQDNANEQLPVSFTALIISLAGSAMMHLGEAPNPADGKNSVNLGLARNTIDLIAMLKEKTSGNLDEEETKLIEAMLYELRTKFVAARGPA
jgi:hypothetical protein